MNDTDSMRKQIREPSQKECDVITELQSTVLGIIRDQFPSAPLNVCLYTAFLPDEPNKVYEWQFSSYGNEVKMNLWVSHDPEYAQLKADLAINDSIFDQLKKAVKRPRSVLATHHWERCRLVWGNSSSGIGSERNNEKHFNGRFEFDYQPSSREISQILSDCNDWINTQGGHKSLQFFQLLNELDDPILTRNNTQPFQTICYTRIPYLSVPLATIYIPKKDDDNLSDIQDNLWKATQRLQPILATYVQTAIQQFAKYFTEQIKEEYWQSRPDQVIPSVLGLAVSSVLFPKEVKIYDGVNAAQPFLTICLSGNNPNSATKPVKITSELNLRGLPVQPFQIEITLLDHENPYLNSLEDVSVLWENPTQTVERVAQSSLYNPHLKMFEFALKPIITSLEAFADLQRTKALAGTLRTVAQRISANLSQEATALDELSKAQEEHPLILRQLRTLARQLNGDNELRGQDLKKTFKQIGAEHFKDFLNEYDSENGIKHAIELKPLLVQYFCSGVKSLAEASLNELKTIYGNGRNLAKSFCKWLGYTVKVELKGREINWPIFIQPAGMGHEYKKVIKQALQEAFGENINVELKPGFNRVDWGSDLPLLCFLGEFLFNTRKPDQSKVTVYYDNEWELCWVLSKFDGEKPPPTCFLQLAKTVEPNMQHGLSDTKLAARVCFLWKIYGSISGRFQMESRNHEYHFTMKWGIERKA